MTILCLKELCVKVRCVKEVFVTICCVRERERESESESDSESCVCANVVCVNHLKRCKTSTSDFTCSFFVLLLAREKMLNFYP